MPMMTIISIWKMLSYLRMYQILKIINFTAFYLLLSFELPSSKFSENGGIFGEEIEKWMILFNKYDLEINYSHRVLQEEIEFVDWMDTEIDKWDELFEKIADEVFYFLFLNRSFLIKFNSLISERIKLSIPAYKIKRTRIPEWVKRAIFHRDKGVCVFCEKDLTAIYNTITKKILTT